MTTHAGRDGSDQELMVNDDGRHTMIDFMQMKTFADDPLVLAEGSGIRVTDVNGRAYIDGLSGTFCASLGHGNEELADAGARQLHTLAMAAPTLSTNVRALEMVDRLRGLLPDQYTVIKLLSGGSEATESAMKIARQFHKQTGNATRYKILSHYRSYHGATGHAVAASGWPGWRSPYEPLAGGSSTSTPRIPSGCPSPWRRTRLPPRTSGSWRRPSRWRIRRPSPPSSRSRS